LNHVVWKVIKVPAPLLYNESAPVQLPVTKEQERSQEVDDPLNEGVRAGQL